MNILEKVLSSNQYIHCYYLYSQKKRQWKIKIYVVTWEYISLCRGGTTLRLTISYNHPRVVFTQVFQCPIESDCKLQTEFTQGLGAFTVIGQHAEVEKQHCVLCIWHFKDLEADQRKLHADDIFSDVKVSFTLQWELMGLHAEEIQS